jgi:hypothetical protein
MNSDQLDRLLDGALATYAQCEPRPGLTARVLVRVSSEGRSNRWIWAWAIPLLAGIAIVAVPKTQPVEPIRAAVTVPEVPREAYIVPVGHAAPAIRKNVPKQRPLLALARFDSETAAWLSRSGTPIEVQGIEIRPLQIDGLATGEFK